MDYINKQDYWKISAYTLLFFVLTLVGDWSIRYIRFLNGFTKTPKHLPSYFSTDYITALILVIIIAFFVFRNLKAERDVWKPIVVGVVVVFSLTFAMTVFTSPDGFQRLIDGGWKNLLYYTIFFGMSCLTVLVAIEVSLRGFQFMNLRRRTE